MVIFIPASFGGGAIYHRVRNGDTRLTVVSVFGLVAGKIKWWCNPTFEFCDHLTIFKGG